MKHFIKAALIDLDGVVTNTSRQHSRAWKKAFDEFREFRKREGKQDFEPFNEERDYSEFLHGVSRYEGASALLSSRGLHLPQGSPGEEAGFQTVCGLGNYKNLIFKNLISEEGVEINDKNVQQIRDWKAKGIRTAVISSSKNCKRILQATGLEELFEVRIDGIISAERNIPAKPAPDVLFEAVEKLRVNPGETMVVEDSVVGVEAARRGNFQLIIGIEETAKRSELLAEGADIVVQNLQELQLKFRLQKRPSDLPQALENFREVASFFPHHPPLLFLDFDGTLSPIVEHHEDAAISEEMRSLVEKLSRQYPVAVVSGRGLADVRKRVNLPDIFYAGSHGFEISGPNGYSKDHEDAIKVIPVFDEIEPVLRKKLAPIKGVDFERKKFTLAIHYRQVSEDQESTVHSVVAGMLKAYPEVIKSDGKKVIEIRPAIDWHKGKAVEFLKKQLSEEKEAMSIYVGDDVTDEDAFQYVKKGLGILVGEHGKATYADYRLENLEEVKAFFRKLLEYQTG